MRRETARTRRHRQVAAIWLVADVGFILGALSVFYGAEGR
jgi:hypothetical protein